MTLRGISEELGLEVRCGHGSLDLEVTGGYVSDLLSDVIAHAEAGNLWITLQIHPNITAVAVLKELAGIVLINGREPEAETARKAGEEGIPILLSPQPAFVIAGKLFQLIGAE